MNTLATLLAMCWQGLTNLLFASILISTLGAIVLTFIGLVCLRLYQHRQRHQRCKVPATRRRTLHTFQGTHTL
jgi:positive regulator of sigma E activity